MFVKIKQWGRDLTNPETTLFQVVWIISFFTGNVPILIGLTILMVVHVLNEKNEKENKLKKLKRRSRR